MHYCSRYYKRIGYGERYYAKSIKKIIETKINRIFQRTSKILNDRYKRRCAINISRNRREFRLNKI